jgi:small subunit ribosomal protein S19
LAQQNQSKNRIALLNRNIEITSVFIGKTFQVYSGRKHINLNITEEMVGHKVGEFIPTREKFIYKKKKKK